ncbi:1,4-dihydroxy-2-naphthoate polyprenyltransferase [bacterium]|nr:1,4-dihydroxy-2-naphthoate polyprenyltransferase [bacterium]
MTPSEAVSGGIRGANLSAWVVSARPRTLPAAVAPVVVGTAAAMAAGGFRPGIAGLCLAGMLMLQVGANLLNDWGDSLRGADAIGRVGPVRALQSGALSPRAVFAGGVAALASAVAIGIALAAVGGWPVVAVGILGLVGAAGYTAGPYPFAYHGLGEWVVFWCFGPLPVCATEFLQAGRVSAAGAIASIALGLLAAAILVVNNVRDAEGDRLCGKRTIAVLLGVETARLLHPAFVAGAAAVPLLLWASGLASVGVMASWLALPLAARPVATVLAGREAPEMNAALAGTARLMLVFALLLSLGLAAG